MTAGSYVIHIIHDSKCVTKRKVSVITPILQMRNLVRMEWMKSTCDHKTNQGYYREQA